MRRTNSPSLFLLLGALVAASVPATATAEVTIARDGQPLARIHAAASVMSAEDPNIAGMPLAAQEQETQRRRLRESVKDLAKYLEKISGAKFEISTEAPAAGGKLFPIVIGEPAVKEFGAPQKSAPFRQGFRVVVKAAGVGLTGESDLATSYAVYEILDRLGCRWYMPGPMGEVIPKKPTVALAEGDLSSAPGTIYRGIWYADDDYKRRNRLGGLMLNAGHALEMYLTKEDRAAHPEWIAVAGGKPSETRLHWSHAGVAEAIAGKILEAQKKNPATSYSISPDDGLGFDESAEDRALDAGDFDPVFNENSITDRLMVLSNRIVDRVHKEHPDVLFGLLAYVNYTRPPVREKVHPNIVPQIAPITYSRAHPLDDDRVPDNKALRDLIEGWGKKSKMTSMYYYGWFLAEPVAPFPMIRKWSVDAPFALKNNCQFWQPETLSNFETSMHGLYLGFRLAWEPERKPSDIIDEINRNFYGHAGKEMAAYWDYIDSVWVDVPEYSGCGFGYLRRWTPERLAESRRLLDAGIAAAQTPEEKYRVKLANDSLLLFEEFMRLRRELAEGRWDRLGEYGAAWRDRVVKLGDEHQEAYAFTKVFWTPKTVNGSYFEAFYQNTYDDASRMSAKYNRLTQPIREWRFAVDKEKQGEAKGWAAKDFSDAEWKSTDVCTETWSTLGHHGYFGSAWYRTKVDLQPAAGKKIYLWLGATDGSAKVFINGKHVPYVDDKGAVKDAFEGYCQAASFDITAHVAAGENSVAILATRTFFNELGTGGLIAPVAVYSEK